MILHRTGSGVNRPYRAPRRDQQARATRVAIMEAALELFTTQGYQATSIRQVAERAAVSEQTVYNGFGDKVGLLCDAGMHYISSDADGAQDDLVERLAAEPDPIERFRMAARDSRETWEAGADALLQLERMLSDPDIRDPRVADLAREVMRHRLNSARVVCEVLFPEGTLRPDLTLGEVAEFATAVDSATTVTTMLGLGWTMDQWEQWLVKLFALFVDPRLTGQTTSP